MEGLVRNVGNFSRCMEATSFSHASVLNVTNVARECEVERKTVEGYLDILEDILLGLASGGLYRKKAKRQLAGHPKFYLFDAGVFRSLGRPDPWTDRKRLKDRHWRAWLRSTSGHGSPMQRQ